MIIFLSSPSSWIHHLIILTWGKPGTAASFGPAGFQTVISGMFQSVHLFLLPIFNNFHFSPHCQRPKHFTIYIFPLSHLLTFPSSTRQYVWFKDWVSGKHLASWLPYSADSHLWLGSVSCVLHQKRSKPAKNGHFCRLANSSLKWGASILPPCKMFGASLRPGKDIWGQFFCKLYMVCP